jgi:hypothetical protein
VSASLGHHHVGNLAALTLCRAAKKLATTHDVLGLLAIIIPKYREDRRKARE